MAQFTQSIRNMIIEQADADSNDISTVDGIYDSAMSRLFTGEGINAISEEYRKNFVVGFTLHFWNYELGLETETLWKMKLFEKLFNRGAYINEIYAHLDKQIFSNYRVRKVDDERKATIDVTRDTNDTTDMSSGTTHSNTNVVDGESSSDSTNTEKSSISLTGSDTDSGTVSSDGTSKSNTTDTGDTTKNSIATHSGTSESVASGKDTTGVEISATHDGTNIVNGVKTDEYGRTQTAAGKTEYKGTETNTDTKTFSGSETEHSESDSTRTDNLTRENTGTVKDSGSSTHDANNTITNSGSNDSFFSDTPQGQLSMENLRNANYMTNATIGNSTTNQHDVIDEDDTTSNTRTDNLTEKNTGTVADASTMDKTRTFADRQDVSNGVKSFTNREDDTSSTTTDGGSDKHSDNTTTTDKTTDSSTQTTDTTYGKTDTRTDNLTDQTSDSESHSNAGISESSNTNTQTTNMTKTSTQETSGDKTNTNKTTATNDVTTSDNGSSKTEGTTTHTGAESLNTVNAANGTVNEMNYEVNWEMLYQSMPLLNKVWEQFDDLFMFLWN